jgi:hypothetical protein
VARHTGSAAGLFERRQKDRREGGLSLCQSGRPNAPGGLSSDWDRLARTQTFGVAPLGRGSALGTFGRSMSTFL